MRRSGFRELIRDGFGFRSTRDLEVVTAASEIDHTVVMRVLEHTNEHAVVEALAVTAQKLARLGANDTRANRAVVSGDRLNGATHEIESFLAGQALAGNPDVVGLRRAGCWLLKCRSSAPPGSCAIRPSDAAKAACSGERAA